MRRGLGLVSVLRKIRPSGTVERLNEEVSAALADPKMKARLADIEAMPVAGSATDFARFIAAEIARYRDVIRTANLKAR